MGQATFLRMKRCQETFHSAWRGVGSSGLSSVSLVCLVRRTRETRQTHAPPSLTTESFRLSSESVPILTFRS